MPKQNKPWSGFSLDTVEFARMQEANSVLTAFERLISNCCFVLCREIPLLAHSHTELAFFSLLEFLIIFRYPLISLQWSCKSIMYSISNVLQLIMLLVRGDKITLCISYALNCLPIFFVDTNVGVSCTGNLGHTTM